MNKLLLLASCVFAVVADVLLVWWAKNQNHPLWCLIVGVILLNVTGVLWAYTMYKGIESTLAITFYALFTVAACSFVGYVIFRESLTTLNIAGLILAIIALILISI